MNKLRAFIAIALTIVTLSQTRPAQSAVGAVVATPVLIAGLAIAGTGVIGGGILAGQCKGDPASKSLCQALVILIAAPVVLVGLVVLDGEQGIAFSELSEEEAARIGVAEAELAVFNAEVDQANMLLADVKAELSKKKTPSEKDSVVAWQRVKDMVSPETYSTMQKIVSQK